ncbi:MAG: sugar phosphate isomerase/epimerase [Gemmatimonadota bacterium]|nr:sugar phosphate isomerase/epimerase [Gemmatimonadota bacterium]
MHVGMRIPPMGRELGLEGVVAWASECGFGSVDVPEVDAGVRGTFDRAELAIGTVDWGVGGGLLSQDAEVRKRAVAAMKRRIHDTGVHGSGVVFLCLAPDDGMQSRSDSFEIFKAVYPGVVDYAEQQNVHLAIEPYPGGGPGYGNLGCTPETLRAVFEVVPSPHLGICYDPSHFIRIGVDYQRLLMEFGDRVRHVHAKDTELLSDGLYLYGSLGQSFGKRYGHGEGWWRYCIPGWGEADWIWIVARLEEFGYDGPLAIELEDDRFMGSTALNQEGLLAAKAYLEDIIR